MLLLVLLQLISCKEYNNSQESSLLKKISELESVNKKLNDSLTKMEETFLLSQVVLGFPDDIVMKYGEKTNIQFIFYSYDRTLPKYDVYKVEGDKEIKVLSGDKTRFNYEFTPKKIGMEELNLKIKMTFNEREIIIPAGMILPVKK